MPKASSTFASETEAKPVATTAADQADKTSQTGQTGQTDQSNQADQKESTKPVKRQIPVMPLKNGASVSGANGSQAHNSEANSADQAQATGSTNGAHSTSSSKVSSGDSEGSNGQHRRNDTSKSGGRGLHISASKQSSAARTQAKPTDSSISPIKGVLDLSRDGHGVVRVNYSQADSDAYISTSQVRRLKLRQGDVIEGFAREPKENERYWGMTKVEKVNEQPAQEFSGDRIKFYNLTPVYPNEQIKLETGDEPLSLRIIDMIAPIGKGQRSLIVSPPKAGKTTLLKDMATGIARNHPEIHLMAVLVGERPEEVTDIRRHIHALTNGIGEVAASNFDEPADEQCRVAELALERAKRMVEAGRDVLILLDSITRLARAYNLAIPTSGRTLSGGFDPAALFPPKKFFGAARNFEVPGSLTIIGTALVDTGSRMDDLVYEEFKGTGNQEVHLDRYIAERRIYPAIDVQRSGTRRDDLLIDPVTYQSIVTLHRMLDMVDRDDRTNTLISQMKRTKSNKEFLAGLKAG